MTTVTAGEAVALGYTIRNDGVAPNAVRVLVPDTITEESHAFVQLDYGYGATWVRIMLRADCRLEVTDGPVG